MYAVNCFVVRHGLTLRNFAMRYDAYIAFRIFFGLITLLRTNLGDTLNTRYQQNNRNRLNQYMRDYRKMCRAQSEAELPEKRIEQHSEAIQIFP
jgi:hypothetical protein